MEKKSLEELQPFILARFHWSEKMQARMQKYFSQQLGVPVLSEQEDPIMNLAKEKFYQLSSQLIAERLIENQRNVALISSKDVESLVDIIMNEKGLFNKEETDDIEIGFLKNTIKQVFENGLTIFERMSTQETNDPYEDIWKWIESIIELSRENNLGETEFLSFENSDDLLTNRMYTKEQFLSQFKKGISEVFDVKVVKKIFVEPMINLLVNMAGESDQNLRKELEEQFEAQMMPALKEKLEKVKPIMSKWIEEEAERIYA